jgi:hypothetical protein
MQTYYLYHLHPNGRIAAREVIKADDKAKAIALAERASRGDPMELWLGPVKVHVFPALPRR